ncbi:MAG: DNA repair protein RadA, partial [Acidobacteriota bacterium]
MRTPLAPVEDRDWQRVSVQLVFNLPRGRKSGPRLAMAKVKTTFVCQGCGSSSSKWLGRCPDCGAWNSLVEEQREASPESSFGLARWSADGRPRSYTEVTTDASVRLPTDIEEFDRVLGGGLVAGSLVLIGGDPGIGKSTLLLQVAARLASGPRPVLYVSGEESERQIKLRGERLGIRAPSLLLYTETSLERILEELQRHRPAAVVLDSVQTVCSTKFSSAPGSISQVREVTAELLYFAKSTGTPVFLIGHVTKEGYLAGPKALEHMVDTVLYFEGERHHAHRVVRATKNRYGAAGELGVFEMTGAGLVPVVNPSGLFLSERQEQAPGSAVVCCLEGTRPLLLEIQALVSRSSFGYPRRVALGFDS